VHLQVEEVRLLDQGDQPVLGHGFFLRRSRKPLVLYACQKFN
jgi:hypothetical protein